MRSILLAFAAMLCGISAFAQNSVYGNIDPNEVRYYDGKPYDKLTQQRFRENAVWKSFLQNNGTWYVHFNEYSGMPHRAYGAPLTVSGSTLQDKAIHFAQQQLSGFHIPVADLQVNPKSVESKYTYVNFAQMHDGLNVIGSRYVVKFYQDQIIMFGCDVYPNIDVETTPTLSLNQANDAASANLQNTIVSISNSGALKILPIPTNGKFEYHLVYDVMVKTMSGEGVPANYETYVDAHNGQVLSRRNTVSHFDLGNRFFHPGKPHTKAPPQENVLQVDVTLNGTVYPSNPFDATVVEGLRNVYITSLGNDYPTDIDGNATVPVAPGSTATIRLMGPWSRIYTNGNTPSMNVTLNDGQNTFSMDNSSTIKERCAYRSVQQIHDFHKIWMPVTFTQMDFQLPTNVDVTGTCNAFYDGTSINFYDIGGGCNASSLVSDVCHHEYGHGINDKFYQSQGGNFINGAMGEGYADFWALSLNNNPVLGTGFNTDNMDPIRRYDIDPKVYPSDLVGEVHSDGEIIMGAWWDTHLLMGADWNVTMPLFVEAYHGLQAQTSNGNEGEAYTDVLIDLLQADDNDGDITNGTPNGNAIIEGFYIHGITLISNATLNFAPILFANTNTALNLEVELQLNFPYTQYLQDVNCFYKIDNGNWNETPMIADGNGNYSFEVTGQPASTVISYYFGAHDINQSIGAVIPIGAHLNPFPNLPYFTLIGVTPIGIHDSDDNADFGSWQTGIIGDNSSTGEWEEDSPIGSYTTDTAPGTMVAVDNQHTPGGEVCFLTGNASSSSAGIGENDVDDGKTTLQSPNINMADLVDPVVAYWRYYTNNPPGGANPGQDYWQVRISNDGGANWTYVENNKTADMSWRRNAFHVSDYVTPTNQVRFQFIASDSTIVGANLDGGSLIEAAVDDFIVYDALIIGVEDEVAKSNTMSVYPNPAKEQINIKLNSTRGGSAQVSMINQLGQTVFSRNIILNSGEHIYAIDLPELAQGNYKLILTSDHFTKEESVYISK